MVMTVCTDFSGKDTPCTLIWVRHVRMFGICVFCTCVVENTNPTQLGSSPLLSDRLEHEREREKKRVDSHTDALFSDPGGIVSPTAGIPVENFHFTSLVLD